MIATTALEAAPAAPAPADPPCPDRILNLPGHSPLQWVIDIWNHGGRVVISDKGYTSIRVTCAFRPALDYIQLALGGLGKITARTWQVGAAKDVLEVAIRLSCFLPEGHADLEELEVVRREARIRPARQIPGQWSR